MDQSTKQKEKIMGIQLSDAIDRDLATLACNERPEGWRVVEFDNLIAYASPDCPDILGEIEPEFEQGPQGPLTLENTVKFEVTLKDLRQAGACYSGYNKLVRSIQGKPFTGEDDSRKSYIHHAHDKPIQINSILESNGLDDAIWALRCVKNADRNIRLFGVWCARQVQHLIEDHRAMNALDVAERFANGNASAEARAAARDAALAAALDAALAAARYAAWAAAGAAAGDSAGAAAWAAGDSALAAARAAAWAAGDSAWNSAWAAARAAAEASQEEMLKRMCQGKAEWQTVKALVTH